jgi:hypothetical protein
MPGWDSKIVKLEKQDTVKIEKQDNIKPENEIYKEF